MEAGLDCASGTAESQARRPPGGGAWMGACPYAVVWVDCRGVFDDTWMRGAGVQKLDLVIRNGTVVDGTGAARVVADVGVRGDRIVGVGQLAVDAASTIDAAGRIVAPGFIGVHAHDDF